MLIAHSSAHINTQNCITPDIQLKNPELESETKMRKTFAYPISLYHEITNLNLGLVPGFGQKTENNRNIEN